MTFKKCVSTRDDDFGGISAYHTRARSYWIPTADEHSPLAQWVGKLNEVYGDDVARSLIATQILVEVSSRDQSSCRWNILTATRTHIHRSI